MITTYNINLINSIILISLSLWGYFDSPDPSETAFIPTGIGIILLLCSNGIKNHNKMISHIAVLLTLLAIGGLSMALKGSMDRSDDMAIIRVSIMMITSVIAMIFFVKSFIDARKK
tara:strand:+ start:219 stop:566 length:348 start_codon:yes stop_codon:yes gene_type:complete